MISKTVYILVLALALASCARHEAPNAPDAPTDSGTPCSGQGDVEIVDSIPLETGDTASRDTLVNPDVALVPRWPLQYEVWEGHFVMFIDSLSPRVA